MKNSNARERKNNITSVTECGNCWGYQEYEGEIIEKEAKNDDKSQDGFIMRFVKKYF